MANEINDLKRILLLVLIAIPAIVSVNINCHGKAFHCVNSTHFMICVDLGGGLSTTIDDFVIPCPATTVCHGHNIFECEFPKIEETLPLHVIGVEKQSDISETTLVTNSVTEPTATSDTVSDFNETVLTTARPEEEIVLNAFLIENNNETTVADKDNTTAISFRTIDSAKEINDKQSNNSNVTTISAIDTKNISVSDKSKSADTNTTTVECIILKPITDLDIRTTPLTEELTSSDTFNNNNNSTADELNVPSQIVPSDISILTSEVNLSSAGPLRHNIATNIEQNITTQLMSNNNNIDNVPDSTTAISSEIPVVHIELRPAFPVDVVRTTNNDIPNQNPTNEKITTESPLLVTNTDNNNNNSTADDLNTPSQIVPNDISIFTSKVNVSSVDPPRDNIETNIEQNITTQLMSNNNNLDNVPDSTTAISSEIPVVFELRPAFPVDVVRTTNNEILNPINEYITTESPLFVTNTVHPTHLNEINLNVTESQYVGGTSPQVDVSTSQNNLRTTPPKDVLTSSNSFNNMSNNNKIDNVLDSTTAITSEIPIVNIELRPAFPVDVVRTTNNEIPNPNPINEYITTESPLLVTNTVHPTHINEVNFNDTESQYVAGMVDMPKPLVETDIVNLKLDKRDFITESLDLPQIFENSTNYIDSYSNILRTSQPTVSVPSSTPPTIRDLLNGPNELSALNNDKVDIIIKEIINTDNTTVHVFADEATNTIAPYSANDNNNNKTMVILTSENYDLNDRDSNNITENFTLTKSDSILDHAVNGVLPSIQITETDKTFIPLADQFNNNVTQTVMRTSPISVLNENLESGIVNLTLDKNEFFRSAPLTENTPHSTANNTNTLRVRANAVLESIPTLKDDGNLPIHQKLKLSVPNNEKVDITKEQTNTNNAIVQVQANEAIKTITTDTSNNNNNKIIKFSTEHEDLNDQKSKNNTDINSVNGVIPSIQITEIAKTLVPIVQLNTNTIQNVPNVTPHTVLAPKENLIYATPSSPTDRLENTIRNIPNATPHMVLATEDNSNIATPSIIDLVSEPASVGTDNQPALDNMAGPLRIDQLNATVIPNTRITTMPIDYTSKINKILKQNNGKVDVIEQPITPKAIFNNDVVTIAAVATSGNMSNKIIDQNYMEHGNKTDLILEPEPVESGAPMTTEKGFVLLPVELDSTTMQNVLNVTPHTNVLTAEGISNFDILENPNVQTEAVISERSVLATKPVTIVPIEINSVKIEPKFTEPNNLTNHVMTNVSKDVASHNNDFILEPAIVNSNTIPNRGSGIITDIVEVKPFINNDVLSVTPLNEIVKIASTTVSPATADEIITKKSIQETDKHITEKPIVPIGIATSEVDTSIKIKSNTEQNSISETKSTDVNYLEAQNRIDHLSSIQISPTDNILTAIKVPSSDSRKIDQITNLETSYNEKVHSIAEKPILVATENIAIAASTEPTANGVIAITNDNVVPTTDEVPLQLTVDSNIVGNNKDKSLVPIPVHLVPEDRTEHLTSTQISPTDVLTTVGVAHTNLSQGQTTNLETSYNVNSIPEKPTLVATENIGITASTVPSAGVEIAMTNDNVVPTTNQVPLLMTKYGNIVDSEKDKSSVPMVPIPIHLVPGNGTEHLISTQISPTDLLTTVGVSYTDSSTIDNITKLEIPFNEKVLNIPEKSILATENMVITASTQPAANGVIAMTNHKVVPTTDQVPFLMTKHSNIVDNEKDISSVPIPVNLIPENSTEHLTSTQISPTDTLTIVGVSHTDPNPGLITNLETTYNEKANSISEKPTLAATENFAIAASTEPSADVVIAITNDNVVPTTDELPLQLTVNSNIVDNNKDKSLVSIPVQLVPENSTEHLTSTQISPTDILTTVGVSQTNPDQGQITILEIPYNEKVINIPEKSTLATENMVITASTEPVADVVIAMTNDNVVPTTDQVPLLMTKHGNIVDKEKNKFLVPIPVHLEPENSTERLISTQISPTDTLTTVGVSQSNPSQGQITIMEIPYNEKVINIPEKSTLATENMVITASTQPAADVVIAMTNNNLVPTSDQVPILMTKHSNVIDNEKDISSATIPKHLVPENLTSTQISPTDILTTVGVSQTNPSQGQITILEIPYNEKVINIPEKSTLGMENIGITASTEPSANGVIAMTINNVVPTKDQVPLLMTKYSNIVDIEKDISSVSIPINLVPENNTEHLTSTISPTNTLTIVDVPHTNPSQGQIINLETSYNEKVNSIPEKSTLATDNIGIATSAVSSADGAIVITNDNVVPTTDQVPLLMTKHSNIVDTEIDKSSGIYLVGQNNAEQLTSTPISPTDTNPSPSQITNLETSYNEKVNSVPDKSTLGTDNIGITASTRPSANGVIAMTNDNVVPTKDQLPLQLTVDSNIVDIEKGKSSVPIPTNLVPENSTGHLTSTQISPTDTLTIVGVSHTNPSQAQTTNPETSYNVNIIPTKSTLATDNIGIITNADSFVDSAIAITNDNVVPTTDQVPLLIIKHSNIVNNEKDKSSVSIESTSIKAPAMTNEVNTSTAVNIQIKPNKTDNAIPNTFSDIHLAEQNSAAVMNSQTNLVAKNNTPYLISKIKLQGPSQSVLNSHKVAATIDQEIEPLSNKPIMETYDATKNTAAPMENSLTINPYENHKTTDLIQNNKNSLKEELVTADSNKLPQTDLNVNFIDNTSPVSNRIMITQSVSNEPLHTTTSYNGPVATKKTSQSPGNTIIKKITQFDCITPDMINLGNTEASTEKTFAESGKVTKIAAPTVISKDNIQSTIDLKESIVAQTLQNTATSSPTVLVSTNYNTASIPSAGQAVDTVVIADLVNNKPTQSDDVKTLAKSPIPIADITTSEVITKDISIGSNNRGSILDTNKNPLSHEISLISSATKTVEDLPSLSGNKTAVPTDSVQEIITKHAIKEDFIDSGKTSENKATVSMKQLHNLGNVNFKSVSNVDMWTSTGQDVGSQIPVQSNSASATHAPTFTVTENLSPNNLGNHQIQNTFTNIYSPPREYSQTTVTKTSSSNYYLGSINTPQTMHPKINSDAVKTIYSSLTNIPKRVNIQTASTPHYIIKTTNQNQDTSKQFNAPGTFTLTVNSVSSPSMETLTKHSIQNKIEKIISDQKVISIEQNSDKRIPIANPTAFTTNSNTDEGIKIVSTYNTVNSQNTMPSAILQVSSSYPSLSKKYVNTFQIKNPNDLNKLKASITEYMNNVAKTEGVVPAVETKQSTSNIMSTLGLNSINNRNVTYTTTLHSNSFDRVNPTKPTVNYVIKRIVNDIGPKGVVTTNSENVQNIFENGPLNGFTSGSIRPADNLGTVVVYKQSTVNNPLITESQVLSTKVHSIPTTIQSSGKSSFSTLVPFVSTSSDPTHRIVINSNTPMSQSPLLVKLINNINSQQDFLSRVKKDQSVTADSNIQYFIKSPKPDSMVETMIFTKEKVNEPFLVSEILGGFRRSNDDSSKTSVQNVVDSKKDDIGSIPNNNERDTNANPIKLLDINGADTVKDSESDGEGSKDNVESVKIEENKPTEKTSMSKDSTVKPDANIQNKFLPPSPVTSRSNTNNNLTDLKLRREIPKTYPTGAIESVASQGNLQTEALKVNENKYNSSYYINITSEFQKYPAQLNSENQTDNGSVNIVKRNNNTINDNLVDLTSTNHTVTAYVQSYLNKDGKQGNKTGDELRLNERSMLKANTANVQSNASSKVKSTSTDSPPVFNCTARGRFADKKDCRKFYTCIGNLQPIMGTCPNNTVFSEINKQCTRNLSHCVRNNQFRCLLEGRFSDFFKDNIYYICVRNCTNHFTRYKLQCQDGYHLDKETVRCERDEMTSTQSASSVSEVSNDETTIPKPKSEKIKSSSDDFECEKEGNFPYGKDCRKYYVCTKVKDVYRRKIKKCSKDEMYDKKKKKCVDSDSKEC